MKYFSPTPKQNEVFSDILSFKPEDNTHKHIALFGGGRSGKTTLICWTILMRALISPKSTHIIIRDTNQSITHSIFEGTLMKLTKEFYPFNTMWKNTQLFDKKWKDGILTNRKELTMVFPNGSKIYCAGLSTDNALERILGMECSSLYLNECSSLKPDLLFSGKSIASRLAEKCEIDPAYQEMFGKYLDTVIFYDFNPPYKNHWTYSYFIERKNPINDSPLEEKLSNSMYVANVNPIDNPYISNNYIESMKAMGDLAYKRFVLGEFQDISGKLINVGYFQYYNKEDLDKINFERVFITTDYALEAKRYSDFNVFCYWGIVDKKLYLLDMLRFKEMGLEANERLEKFYIKCGNRFGVEKILIENVSSSKVLIQMNKQKFYSAIKEVSRTKNKYARLISVLAEIEARKIYLPSENMAIPAVSNVKKEILQPFLLEMESFTHDDKHDHDDVVDNLIDAIVFSELMPRNEYNVDFFSINF